MDGETSSKQTTAHETSLRLYELERSFHDQIIAESDRARRQPMYGEFYGRLTEFFQEHDPNKKSFGSFSPSLMRLLVPFIRGKTVLDFGCGYGSATFDLAGCAKRVLAADVSAPMIHEMQRRIRERPVENIEPLWLGDDPNRTMNRWTGAIDVVYSNDVVEHLHPDDLQDHLTLMLQMLRSGGLYVCITPNRITGPHDVSAQFLPYHAEARGAHLREYSHRDLSTVFWRCGFGKIRTPVTALGYNRFRSDAVFRCLLVPPHYKFLLESLWFERARKHRAKLLNLFCLNTVILFAWKK